MSVTEAARPVDRVLTDVVLAQAQASVLLTGASQALPARFEAFDGETVTLSLYGVSLDGVAPGVVGLVQFDHATRRRSFMAPVQGTDDANGTVRLTLRRPSEVARAELRRAFRVPLQRGELPVEVVGPDGPCMGHVDDVSRLGMGIRLRVTGAPPAVGDAVRIRFEWSGERLVLAGCVIQTSGEHLGVAFTADVADLVGALVDQAEARWLQRRHG